MAVALRDTFIDKNFNAITVDFVSPASSTSSETFTFSLNNSNDDILIVVDATMASPGNYTVSFDRGSYSSAKTPAQIIIQDGFMKLIAVESGVIEKKNATAAFTVTSASGAINGTGIKIALLKRRFVTNH